MDIEIDCDATNSETVYAKIKSDFELLSTLTFTDTSYTTQVRSTAVNYNIDASFNRADFESSYQTYVLALDMCPVDESLENVDNCTSSSGSSADGSGTCNSDNSTVIEEPVAAEIVEEVIFTEEELPVDDSYVIDFDTLFDSTSDNS